MKYFSFLLLFFLFSCATNLKESAEYWNDVTVPEKNVTDILENKNCYKGYIEFKGCYRAILGQSKYLLFDSWIIPEGLYFKSLKKTSEYSFDIPGFVVVDFSEEDSDFVYKKYKEKVSYSSILEYKLREEFEKKRVDFKKVYQQIGRKIEEEGGYLRYSVNAIRAETLNRYASVVYGEKTYFAPKGDDTYYSSGITKNIYGFRFSEHMDKKIYIKNVLPGSAAFEVGIRYHDEIVGVKDKYSGGMIEGDLLSESLIANIAYGSHNTPIELKVRKSNSTRIVTYKLVKKEHELSELTLRKDGDILIIKLEGFGNVSTCREIRSALKDKPKKVILDLRGNPGGYLKTAKCIGEMFLNKGTKFVTYVGLKNSVLTPEQIAATEEIKAEDPIFTSGPVVVLADKSSASASEIIVAALKDNKRAFFIGNRTFGKGIGQRCSVERDDRLSVFPDESGLIYCQTKSLLKRPSGKLYHSIGIKPDLEIPSHPLDKNRDFGMFYREKQSPLGLMMQRHGDDSLENFKNVTTCLAGKIPSLREKFLKEEKNFYGSEEGSDYQMMIAKEAFGCNL